MEKVAVNLKDKYKKKNFTTIAVSDSETLTEYLLDNSVFMGLEFDDNLKNLNELPRNLKYSIRRDGYSHYNWEVNHILKKKFSKRASYRSDNKGTHYASDLFLCLQNSIDRNFMEILAPEKFLPDIKLKVD